MGGGVPDEIVQTSSSTLYQPVSPIVSGGFVLSAKLESLKKTLIGRTPSLVLYWSVPLIGGAVFDEIEILDIDRPPIDVVMLAPPLLQYVSTNSGDGV